MSMATQDEIRQEFKRQVHLCSNLGQKEMLEVVNKYFKSEQHKREVDLRQRKPFGEDEIAKGPVLPADRTGAL